MSLEFLKSGSGVFKSAVVAKFTVALNLLENWQEDSEDAASPESFKSNDIKWIKDFVSKKFFLGDKLASCEALSS